MRVSKLALTGGGELKMQNTTIHCGTLSDIMGCFLKLIILFYVFLALNL